MNTDFFESWLLALLIRGTVIAGLWSIVAFLFRNASADRLSAWWRCGALSLLIVAFIPWTAARWWIPVNRPAPVWVDEMSVRSISELSEATIASPLMHSETIEEERSALAWWAWIWAIGAAALLVRLIASHVRVYSFVRTALVISNPEVRELLRTECQHAGVRRDIAIKCHPAVKSPFAVGWLRPVIILPPLVERDDDMNLRLVLRHEVAHIARFDVLWQLLAELAVVLHWPNALVWVLRHRLRSVQESAADDAVLAAGTDGPTYATLLFDMARDDGGLSGEPCLAPMARVSALRSRIGLILDTTRRRSAFGPTMRSVLLIGSCGVALAFGLTGMRAQVVAPVSPIITLEESWSRTYRDTFRLEKSFSDKFPGTSDEALTAFRRELAAAGVSLSNSMKLELPSDKTVLRVEFTENDRKVVERKLSQVIARAGWWRDVAEAHKEAVDRVLTQFRDELDARAKSVERAARDMAQAREAGHIVDTDPEDSRGSVSVSNPELLELEKAVRKKTLDVTELREKLERIRLMRPEELKVALRMLNIADPMVEGLQVRLEEALAQDALLKSAGVGDNDPRRHTYRAQVDSVVKLFSASLTSLRQSQEALVEVERRTLEQLEKKLQEKREKREEDKKLIIAYAVAKARYLNERKIYEAAQLRYSAEKIDVRINKMTPSAR